MVVVVDLVNGDFASLPHDFTYVLNFAVTNKQGDFDIADVPPGRYMMHVWNEAAVAAALQALSREVQVGEGSRNVGTVRIPVTKSVTVAHKNKYGQDYEPPSPNNPVYVQP